MSLFWKSSTCGIIYSTMRKAILLILTFISLVLIVVQFGAKPLVDYLQLEPKAGLRVDANISSKVLVNNQEVGQTPFQKEDFEQGEYLVELKNDKSSWQGYIKLYPGTLSVVNRELLETKSASSGEVITLEKGSGVTIVSNPLGAQVLVDGKSVGNTPLTVDNLSSGEHTFLLDKSNFLKRSIKVNLTEGYILNLAVDLAISDVDLTNIPTTPIQASAQVVVGKTPSGFLRIRSNPSTNAQEVTRVKDGDTLVLLEELANWDRVRTVDGKEGYVSSAYVTKKTP